MHDELHQRYIDSDKSHLVESLRIELQEVREDL